ncbi:serine hydrolase domain-containing protein [Henriciella litoralis]|uniref:serine hydrolase domain-containing protein n=1 Tax=Henriciella litoralis TaxID=568102 RepID=UPI00146BC8D9|nr:serine hydrolase domain-containing protein [Henriciella litoralis]
MKGLCLSIIMLPLGPVLSLPCAAASPDWIDQSVQSFADAVGTPGLSLTIMEHGEIAWEGAQGYADLEQMTPMTPQSLMRIGSISKTITAVTTLQIASAGLVDLDATVSDYLPGFAGPARMSTLRQLASHTACVRGYDSPEEEISLTHYASMKEALVRFSDDDLICAPGDAFNYSSYGYTLLAAGLAEASGLSFGELISAQVLDPLGLDSVALDDAVRVIPGRAAFYVESEDGELENAPFNDYSYKYAGAGMLASTRDLAKFGAALVGEGGLAPDAEKAMTSPARLNSGVFTDYGLGLYVSLPDFLEARKAYLPEALYEQLMHQVSGRPIYWHTGTSEGAVSVLMIEPDSQRVLALSINKGGLEKEVLIFAIGLMDELRGD